MKKLLMAAAIRSFFTREYTLSGKEVILFYNIIMI